MSNPADLFDQSSANLRQKLRTAFGNVHERLLASETGMARLLANQSDVVDGLVAAITQNFSDLFTSADQLVTAIRNAEFLSATTETPVSFIVGQTATLLLDAGDNFPFLPTNVVGLTIAGNADDYAFATVTGWMPSTRALSIEIFAVAGEAGPHTGVTVEIAALNTLAVDTIRQAVVAAQAAVLADKIIVADARVQTLGYRNATEVFRDETGDLKAATQYLRNEAEGFRNGAAQSAADAALFDPSSYYTKAQTYTKTEINAAIAAAVDALLSGAPGALDTLNELADALGNDANFATTVTNALAAKQASAEKNQPNGYAGLDGAGLLPVANSPFGVMVSEFSASGTYTVPDDCIGVFVEGWGAGGSGGSGARANAGSARGGGLGGAGGAYCAVFLPANALGATEAVTIGAGPAGAAGQTTNGNGIAGTAGGVTTFGSHLRAAGGAGGAAGTTSGNPNGASGGTAITAASSAAENGGNSANGFVQSNQDDPSNTRKAGAAGGNGGSCTTANAGMLASKGGAARGHGTQATGTGYGAAAGVSGTTPTAGEDGIAFGEGGGGGGGSTSGTGAKGGNGGRAAGGGGGGAGTASGNSGSGGDGGDGFVRVIAYVQR